MGKRTKITFRQTFESTEACEHVKPYAIPGARQTFDKLAKHLAMSARPGANPESSWRRNIVRRDRLFAT